MTTYYRIALFLTLWLSLSACALDQLLTKLDEHRTITINPSPLSYHADSISFEAIVQFENHVKVKPGTEYTLEYSYHTFNGDSLFLGRTFVEDALTGKSRQLTQRLSFPYHEKYKSGEVMAKSILAKGGQVLESNMIKVADGLITTHDLNIPAYRTHLIPSSYERKVVYAPQHFSFFFHENESAIDPQRKVNIDLQLLEDFIARNDFNDEIQIVGYHSPERREASTSALAKNRADATANYIQQLYQKYEQSTIPQMTSRAIFHDWGLFSRILSEEKGLSKQEKEEILSQIDGGVAFSAMDERFKKLKSYDKLKRLIYPKLRQVTVIASAPQPSFTEAEVIVLTKKIVEGNVPVDTLSEEELAYAAAQSPSITEKKQIYQAALQKYKSQELRNNLACVYLKLSENQNNKFEQEKLVERAIIELKKAIKSSEDLHPALLINLAAAQLLKHEEQEALKTIIDLGDLQDSAYRSTVHAMKGYIYLQRGDYLAAIKSLSLAGTTPDVLYDKSLAYLLYASENNLKKVYTKARDSFQEVLKVDPNNGLAHYGAAITAARMNNEDIMSEHLKKAFKADTSLQKRADTDLEFINYRAKDSFKAAFEQ